MNTYVINIQFNFSRIKVPHRDSHREFDYEVNSLFNPVIVCRKLDYRNLTQNQKINIG